MTYTVMKQCFTVVVGIALGVFLMLLVNQDKRYDNMLVTNSKSEILVLKHTILGSYRVSPIEVEMIGEE